MIPTAEQIKPSEPKKSDFFSYRLFRFLKKNPHYNRVYLSGWNSATGIESISFEALKSGEISGPLMIGLMDADWFGGLNLRELCSGAWNRSMQTFAFGEPHAVSKWIDVTEWFWSQYLEKGVCAIHGDNAHDWLVSGSKRRTCRHCGKVEQKSTIMVPQTTWAAV